ncbi:MAG: M20/M25/M40 family metallo-hydrolase [Rhodothermales bacterium]|nr:M20/M25/M40 family metallo-hydrolase [Rhodothermales bacterium]
MEDRLEDLLRGLVACNSVSPTLAGGPGEGEAATFVMDALTAAGLRPVRQEPADGRFNVVARVPGRGDAPPLLLNAHLDTVGTDGMDAPFRLRRDGDRLYGRGAYDMKGSAAVMLALAETLAADPPPGDLWLTFVADEEDRSVGTEHLVAQWLPTLGTPPAAAFVLEPTEEQIGVAHKGFVWFEVEITGQAAHGSRPEQGIDAALPLTAALAELKALTDALAAEPPDARLGPATVHVSRIEAGSEWSVIPAAARLTWERRTLPRDADGRMQDELERVLEAVRAFPGRHTATGRIPFVRRPHAVADDALPVRLLRRAAPDATLAGLSFWTDAALLGPHMPAVLYGPAGHGAHAIDEWVSRASLGRVYQALLRVVNSH